MRSRVLRCQVEVDRVLVVVASGSAIVAEKANTESGHALADTISRNHGKSREGIRGETCFFVSVFIRDERDQNVISDEGMHVFSFHFHVACSAQVGQNAERGRSTTGIREWVWFCVVVYV